MSRRTFLLGLAGTFLASSRIADTIDHWLLPTETPQPTLEPKTAYTVTPTPKPTPAVETTATKKPEPAFAKEIVSGVVVYHVKDQAENDALNDFFRTDFEKRHGIKLSADQTTGFRQVREVLSPTKRFLQIATTERLYGQFKEEGMSTGVDFVTWIKMHVTEMNRMIANLEPFTSLRTELTRIVVYDENSFQKTQESDPAGVSFPVDIDGWFTVWTDFRGIIDPVLDPKNYEVLKSSYLKLQKIDGREALIDYGLIHELFHQLYNTPDEYAMDVNSGNPTFNLEADGLDSLSLPPFLLDSMTRRTPFIAWYLQQIGKLNVRGNFYDERAPGIAGDQENKNTVEAILGLHPVRVTLVFVDYNYRPLAGKVTSWLVRSENDYYANKTNPKKRFALPMRALVDGNFTLTADYFRPQRHTDSDSGEHNIYYPQNWYFEIEAENGFRYKLHLPAAPFIMSAIAGKKDKAVYAIRLHDSDSHFSQQYLEMATLKEVKQASPSTVSPYATMQVDGTDDFLLWYTLK